MNITDREKKEAEDTLQKIDEITPELQAMQDAYNRLLTRGKVTPEVEQAYRMAMGAVLKKKAYAYRDVQRQSKSLLQGAAEAMGSGSTLANTLRGLALVTGTASASPQFRDFIAGQNTEPDKFLAKPMVPLTKAVEPLRKVTGNKIYQGGVDVTEGILKEVENFTSPDNIAMLVTTLGLGQAGSAALTKVFAGQMSLATIDKTKELYDNIRNGDFVSARKNIGELIVLGKITKDTVKHGFGRDYEQFKGRVEKEIARKKTAEKFQSINPNAVGKNYPEPVPYRSGDMVGLGDVPPERVGFEKKSAGKRPVPKQEPVIPQPEPIIENAQGAPKPTQPEVTQPTPTAARPEAPAPVDKTLIRQGKVGDKLSPGEQVLTSTGRSTSPFPQFSVKSKGEATKAVKNIDKWIRENAIEEAKSRGDEHNQRMFEGEKESGFPPASKDAMEDYLFGERPYPTQPESNPIIKEAPAGEAPKPAPVEPKSLPEANVKKTHQMTQEEYRKKSGANAPIESDDFARYHLGKVENGEPGLTVENNKIVIRNNDGIPVAVTTLRIVGGEKVVDDTAVSPDYRRQGLATQLYKKAAEMGYNKGYVENFASNAAKHKIAVEKALSEGKPVPAEVLADYPDLKEKYGKQAEPLDPWDEAPYKPEPEPPAENLFSKEQGIEIRKAPKEKQKREKRPKKEPAFKSEPETVSPKDKVDISEIKAIELPELLDIYRAYFKEGETPVIDQFMGLSGKMGTTNVGTGKVKLATDAFIGDPLQRTAHGKRFVVDQGMIDQVAGMHGLEPSEVVHKWVTLNNEHILSFYRYDPTRAAKYFAHEIGHVDHLSTVGVSTELTRLVSGLKKALNFIPEHPDIKARPITPKERALLRAEAKKSLTKEFETWVDEYITKNVGVTPKDILDIWNAVEGKNLKPDLYDFVAKLSTAEKKKLVADALKGKVPEWVPGTTEKVKVGQTKKTVKIEPTPEEIAAKYKDLINAEIRKRKLIYEEMFFEELYGLTKKWRPFSENDVKYTEYRKKSIELYADAISVLLNNPEMLKANAPLFTKAFFNYADNHPNFRKVYLDLQKLYAGADRTGVLQARHDKIMAMFQREAEMQKRPRPKVGLTRWQEIRRGLYSTFDPAIEPFRRKIAETKEAQTGKKRNAFMRWLTRKPSPQEIELSMLNHGNSAIFQMLRDTQNKFQSIMGKAGLSREQLGMLYKLRRNVNDRKFLANPGGMNAPASLEQLGFFEKLIGKENFETLKKFADEDWKIRQAEVFPVIRAGRIVSPIFMEKIETNYTYGGKFSVLDFAEKNFGKEVSNALYRQKGTMRDIGNPFLNRVLQDVMMMRLAHRNGIILRYGKDLAQQFGPGSKDQLFWPAKFAVGKDKAKNSFRFPLSAKEAKVKADIPLETVFYMVDGKRTAFYTTPEIAKALNGNWGEASQVYNTIQAITAIPRMIYVAKNLSWAFRNLKRDPSAAALQVPGLTWFGRLNWEKIVRKRTDVSEKLWIPGIIQRIVETSKATWKNSFKGESDPIVRQMYQEGAFSIYRKHQSARSFSEQVEYDRMMSEYSLNPEKHSNIILKMGSWINAGFEDAGRFSETASKIATFKHLKEYFPNMDAKTRAYIVQNMGGSPDFQGRGLWHRIINNLFLFSNANKQGIVAHTKAMRMSPAEFLWKKAKYSFVPKILAFYAAKGMVTAIGKQINNRSIEEYGKDLERMFAKIPDHDLRNYQCVPLAETQSGKCVYLAIPEDYESQTMSGVLWAAMSSESSNDLPEVLKAISQGHSYGNVNPGIKFAQYLTEYALNENSVDPWNDQNLVDPKKWKAGGNIRRKAFVQALWNKFGPSWMYRFPYDDIDRIKSELEKNLKTPGFAQTFGVFVRVSDRGLSEKMYRKDAELEQSKAAGKVKLEDYIIQNVNKQAKPGYDNILKSFNDAKAKGLATGRYQDYKAKYIITVAKRNGHDLYVALRNMDRDQRAAKLTEVYKRKVAPEETSGILKQLEKEVMEGKSGR